MSIRNGYHWAQKPPLGSLPDPTHPFGAPAACWVFNEGGGQQVADCSGSQVRLDTVNAPAWAARQSGPALVLLAASDQYLTLARPVPGIAAGHDFTVSVGMNVTTASGVGCILGAATDTYDAVFFRPTADTVQFGFDDYSAATFTVTSANQVGYHVWSFARTGATITLYRDGVSLGSQTAIGTGQFTWANIAYVSRGPSTVFNLDTAIEFLYVHPFKFTATNAAALAASPYDLFLPPSPRRWVTASAAVTPGQHVIATGSGTAPAVTLAATTAGTLLVANVGWRTIGGALTMPAGWLTNGALLNTNSTSYAAQWYYPNNPGGITTVTGTLGGSSTIWAMQIREVAGLGASAGLDQKVRNTTAAGATGSSGALTTTAAAEYLSAGFAADDSSTGGEFGSATGGFAVTDQASAGNSLALAVLDQAVSATGTYTAGVTDSDALAILSAVYGTYSASPPTVWYPALESWFPDRFPKSRLVAVPY